MHQVSYLTWHLAFGTHYIETSFFVVKNFIVMQNSERALNTNPLDFSRGTLGNPCILFKSAFQRYKLGLDCTGQAR